MRKHLLHKLVVAIALVFVAGSVVATPSASAQGPSRDFGAEAGFLSSINQQRAAGGLGPLTLNGSMTAAADGWARAMAEGSFLAHAGDIVSGTPGGWTKVGENVGRGQSVSSLTSAFMTSSSHRANIMDASYTHVGIAVYAHPTDGRIYTTHRFAALPGAAPAAAAPVAVPTAAPAPPTPVPAVPTAVPTTPPPPPAPTATAVPPAPVPPTATAIPPTPVPPTATAVPPTPVPPIATAVPPTATPVPPTPEPEPTEGFGTPPEQLAFLDGATPAEAAQAKLASKLAKLA